MISGEMVFAYDRKFPVSKLDGNVVLVVPDGMVLSEPVRQLRETIGRIGGQNPDVLGQSDFAEDFFIDKLVIACGHMANNAAIRRLYTARCCFVDTFFPGEDGHFVKSISDPFGYGQNCIVVGGSTDEGLRNAFKAFTELVDSSEGELGRIHAHNFNHVIPEYPPESDLQSMIRADLDIWGTGWSASPFRGGKLKDYLWNYYLTDHPVWGKCVPGILAGSIETWRQERVDHPESYHCLFNLQSFIHLWDLIEDSPFYSEDDRKGAVTMFGDLLRHLSGLFYMTEEVNPPGEIRQNHTTFIGLNLGVGSDYMKKRYGVSEFESSAQTAVRIFEGQADCYKPNDDGGVGYAWHVPQETLYYMLYKNDYGYIDNGHVDELCKLAALTTDNMRSEANYGDTAGYPAFSSRQWDGRLWPLMVSTWYQKHPEHLWMLNWLGEGKKPPMTQVLSGLYAGVEFRDDKFRLENCEPEEPSELLGIAAIDLPEKVLEWVKKFHPESHHPDPKKRYFDKLSLRSTFDEQDEYLLLEGLGTTCHGHEDSNAIIRMTWKNRAWLADGDYIRAAPKFHNSIVVSRDGVGEFEPTGDGIVIPPLASLNVSEENVAFGLVQTEAADYNGMDWKRNLFWSKGRYFAVIDELRSCAPGKYDTRCMWRLVGDAEVDGDMVRIKQEGESLYLHSLDGSAMEIVPDLHLKSRWKAYPFADDVIKVLHQSAEHRLEAGEAMTYLNLFTPEQGISCDRMGDRLIRVKDGETVTVLGTGPNVVGGVEISGAIYRLTAVENGVEIQGIQRVGDSEVDSECQVLVAGEHPQTEQLRTGILEAEIVTGDQKPAISIPKTTGLTISWEVEIDGQEIEDISVLNDVTLVGTSGGRVSLRDNASGTERWHQELEGPDPVTSVKLALVCPEEGLRAIAGTEASRLIVFDAESGAQVWMRELQNMWSRGARVTGLAVADLDGTGNPDVLAGTEGWYVNAFTSSGERIWAEWFRYHAITSLLVADADQDGKAEVFVGTEYSTPLTVHNFDGSFKWSTFEEVGSEGNATTPRRGICLKHMILMDVDSDGVLEAVYGTEDGWIYAVKPQDGAEVWHLNLAGEITGLAQYNGRIVASNEFGFVSSINLNGELEWCNRVADWTSHLTISSDGVHVVTNHVQVSRIDSSGKISRSIDLDQPISHLRGNNEHVICARANGDLLRIDPK